MPSKGIPRGSVSSSAITCHSLSNCLSLKPIETVCKQQTEIPETLVDVLALKRTFLTLVDATSKQYDDQVWTPKGRCSDILAELPTKGHGRNGRHLNEAPGGGDVKKKITLYKMHISQITA